MVNFHTHSAAIIYSIQLWFVLINKDRDFDTSIVFELDIVNFKASQCTIN